MTMLRVRGLGKIFDAIDDCPKDMAVSIFGTVDPDGVIGLRAGIYYDIQSIRVSERSEDLIYTYIRKGPEGRMAPRLIIPYRFVKPYHTLLNNILSVKAHRIVF